MDFTNRSSNKIISNTLIPFENQEDSMIKTVFSRNIREYTIENNKISWNKKRTEKCN